VPSKPVGWKVGSPDASLVWVRLHDDTVRYADWNEATLSIAAMQSPTIQPEIVFQLANAPASSDPAAVLEATEWIALGFEIVDSADGGLHAALIVGEPVYVEADDRSKLATELAEFTVKVLKNNVLVGEGAGKNAFGSPALCVGGLADAMTHRGGDALQAGDLISTGALAKPLTVAAGDVWIASLSGIPPSALTLRVT
jgi:2-keto-4-pentenoate hydratase